MLIPVGLEAEGSTILYEQNPFQPFFSFEKKKTGDGDVRYGVAERDFVYSNRMYIQKRSLV